MKKQLLVVTGLALQGAGQLDGQTFPVGPGGQDSYIDSRSYGPMGDRRVLNYGGETRMKIGHADNSNTNYTIGLVQFDLTGTPATGVTRAWVSLAIDPDTPAAGSPAMVTAHAIEGTWDQGTVTWNTRPSGSGEVLGTAMVEDVKSARFQWDITPLYLGWKAGAIENHGVQFVTWDNNGEGFSFVSSENTVRPGLCPQLIVETGAGGGTVPTVSGGFVLHELTDSFSGSDSFGNPGIDPQILHESSQIAITGTTVNEVIVGGWAARMVSEVPEWVGDPSNKRMRNSVTVGAGTVNETATGIYSAGPGGETWMLFDDESLRYQASADGNYLLHHGCERDGQWHSLGLGFAVKKGSGMNAGSVTGEWYVAGAGRMFGLPRTWPPGNPVEHQWLSMESVSGFDYTVTYDGVSAFTEDGTEMVFERTIGDHMVLIGQDDQAWTEFWLDSRDDGEMLGGSYVVLGDGTLTQTVDDEGEEEHIVWNVSADGDVMVSGEWFVDGIWVEGLLSVGVRRPASMAAGDVVGDWKVCGLEPSFHSPDGRGLNREVLGYESVFTLRADGSYLERIEDYRMNQMISDQWTGDGGNPEEFVMRNRVDLLVEGPVVETTEGSWSVAPGGVLTLNFTEDGEAETMQFHVAANGQVMVLSESWDEADSSGCEFVGGVRMPAAPAAGLTEVKTVGTGMDRAVQIPIGGGRPKQPVRVMRMTPGGSWEEWGVGGAGGSILIDPTEMQQRPTQLFRVE